MGGGTDVAAVGVAAAPEEVVHLEKKGRGISLATEPSRAQDSIAAGKHPSHAPQRDKVTYPVMAWVGIHAPGREHPLTPQAARAIGLVDCLGHRFEAATKLLFHLCGPGMARGTAVLFRLIVRKLFLKARSSKRQPLPPRTP